MAKVFSSTLFLTIGSNTSIKGLTKNSIGVFLRDWLNHLKTNIFIEASNIEAARSLFRACSDYDPKAFLFYPTLEDGARVPGFGLEEDRFRKDAVISLGGNRVFCCIGTRASFLEKEIPSNVRTKTKTIMLSSGKKTDRTTVEGELLSLGYKRTNIVFEPGFFSIKGDRLDLFPEHHKNPIRVSFDFDTIESVSIYDPITQLSIKNLIKTTIKDYNKKTQTIDNNSLINHASSGVCFSFISKKDSYSLLHKDGSESKDLQVEDFVLFKKTQKERLKEASSLCRGLEKVSLVGSLDRANSDFEDLKRPEVVEGSIEFGFLSKNLQVGAISLRDVYSKRPPLARWQHLEKDRPSDVMMGGLETLSSGDFVIHKTFGLGIFKGVSFRNGRGGQKECLEIEYKNNSRVFVSLDQIGLVYSYSGSSSRPKISTLGSKKWSGEIKKAKKAAQEVSLELIKVYSEKHKDRPFQYLKENDLGNSLKNSFSFVETIDQTNAITDVFSDMNRRHPMDRLICGDVGFGKTEVAIRAIFKAYLSDRVSVLLCPTTILADQHFITCQERLGRLGLSIGLLSRFRSKKEQEKTIKKLKEGSLDILIGTHRLLSKDVVIPSLGLLIIDEEHRFGVTHKEKIRTLKNHVDILTLTATPIPRTLQQSLVGIRDVSLVLTPPKSRKPIFTTVRYFDWTLINSYIYNETKRGGQVYFLHNDIRSIPTVVEKISNSFPGLIVEGLNGQMSSQELEPIILSFFKGGIDILVCTTIIESGLDVTNANSIIINNAQDFGLSQLYQIRGRVGRGDKQAHCLLMVPNKPLEKTAHKRLKAVEQHTSLGSGYNISMKDLEIRGAGSLFGFKQSGHVSSLGFELYCEILKNELEVVTEEKEGGVAPLVTLDAESFISREYVSDKSTRLDLYYRVSRMLSLFEINQLLVGMEDRFGPAPNETENLFNIAKLRILYKNSSVIKIEINKKNLVLSLDNLRPFLTIEELFSSMGSLQHPNVAGYKYNNSGSGVLCLQFQTFKTAGAFKFLFDCVGLFSFKKKK